MKHSHTPSSGTNEDPSLGFGYFIRYAVEQTAFGVVALLAAGLLIRLLRHCFRLHVLSVRPNSDLENNWILSCFDRLGPLVLCHLRSMPDHDSGGDLEVQPPPHADRSEEGCPRGRALGSIFGRSRKTVKRRRTTGSELRMDRRLVTVSKYLAKYLRHAPHELGLTLQPGGWVPVDDLLAAAEKHGFPISYDELVECVETNDKQRYSSTCPAR